MKRIVVMLVVFVCSTMVYGAEKKYVKEDVAKVGVAGVKARVRSGRTLVENADANRYSVKKLFDGNKNSVWCTRHNESDMEEMLSAPGLLNISFQAPVYIKSITVMNGYQKTKELYHANQRVKNLIVEKIIMTKRSYPLNNDFQLRDSMGTQELSVTKGWTQSINLFKTKGLIFNVQDVYAGAKYQDLCISELRINVSDGIDYVPSVTWRTLKEAIDTNRTKRNGGWSWDGLNENRYQLFNDLLYYVMTGNNEAYLYFDKYDPEGAGSSESMTNLYKPAVNEYRKSLRR